MKTYHLLDRDDMFIDNVEKSSYKQAREYFDLKFSGKYRIEYDRKRVVNVVFK